MQKRVILATLSVGLMALPFSQALSQTTLVVDNDGTGSATDCGASDPAFTTIQAALDFLPDVDANHTRRIILVCPGTYDTGGAADPSVHPDCTPVSGTCTTRVGIGKNALIIVSKHGPRVTRISGAFSYGFTINAHKVTIQGFKVVGGESDQVNGGNIGIFVYGGHENKILHNVVRDAFTLGICIGSNNNIVNGNIVLHNNDGIVLGNATPVNGNFVGCENNPANENVITNNIVRSNDSTGILVWGNSRNSVVGNTVHFNGTGIAISPPDSIVIADFTSVEANRVRDNHTGIVEQGNNTRCDGNNIQHNVSGDPPQGACAPEDNQLNYVH